MRLLFLLTLLMIAGCSVKTPEPEAIEEIVLAGGKASKWPEKLSSFGFFQKPLQALRPEKGVVAYQINAPLFSDYAFKKRFVKVPTNEPATFNERETMDFKEGTILIKNFYYPADFRKPEGKRRIIETRLLVREASQWEALTYLWTEDQEEAYFTSSGATVKATWIDDSGLKQSVDYLVPNQNQCKSCHQQKGKLVPIGPTARQLNMTEEGGQQLLRLVNQGVLDSVPNPETIPALANYHNLTESTERRARAWLEGNCAHCHRPEGPGKTSGLHLMAEVHKPLALGIGKAPVAAGKGSGGLQYDVLPGRPESSILLYRILSTDPGVMMPELGRTIVDREGAALIEQWIREMR
ncbi:MAG: hypothetical protein FJZ78_05760 [Bacteroidetes bacterium]|nr:hypothetical protein [Bacteroidota bacterium]